MTRDSCDVLVVGAGPAGLAATASAARSGAHVGLVDDNPAVGGQIWRGLTRARPRDGSSTEAARWLARASSASIHILAGTRAVAPLDRGVLLAESAAGPLQLRFGRLILATGARELFLPFPGWTVPGVMGAGGLQALVKGGLPIAGKRVVVAGSGPLLLAVAAYLTGKGARVQVVAEQAPRARLAAFASALLRDPAKFRQAGQLGWSLRGVPLRAGCWVTRAHGTERLEAVTLRQGSRTWTLACDYLACGFGLVPNLELPAACGCPVVGGAIRVDAWQRAGGAYCAGEVTGVGGLELSLIEGQIAGYAATGQIDAARRLFPHRARARRFAAMLRRSFAPRAGVTALCEPDTLVCRCEDVAYGDLRQHTSWRSAKLHTRCGMGPCQGRVCGAATRFLFGWTQDSVRPPVTVASIGSLAHLHAIPAVTEESVL